MTFRGNLHHLKTGMPRILTREPFSDQLCVLHYTFLMKTSNCSHQQPPFCGISHHVSAAPLHMRLFQWCWLSLLPHGKSGSLGHDSSWNLYKFFSPPLLWPLKGTGSWQAPRGIFAYQCSQACSISVMLERPCNGYGSGRGVAQRHSNGTVQMQASALSRDIEVFSTQRVCPVTHIL